MPYWASDYEAARVQSSEESKMFLLVFTGSDWCRPCMKLEREVLSQPEFAEFVGAHFVAYRADLPRNSKLISADMRVMHEALLKFYNPEGTFPMLIIVDNDDQLIWKGGYMVGGPDAYLKIWKEL